MERLGLASQSAGCDGDVENGCVNNDSWLPGIDLKGAAFDLRAVALSPGRCSPLADEFVKDSVERERK